MKKKKYPGYDWLQFGTEIAKQRIKTVNTCEMTRTSLQRIFREARRALAEHTNYNTCALGATFSQEVFRTRASNHLIHLRSMRTDHAVRATANRTLVG